MVLAWRASRSAAGGLKTIRATEGRHESRVRLVLVGPQVAVALVLLSGAILLGTSVYRLLQVSPGFDPAGLVTMRINLPPAYRVTRRLTFEFSEGRFQIVGIVGDEQLGCPVHAPL